MIKEIKRLYREFDYILTSRQKRNCILVLFLIMIGATLETLGVSLILPLVQAMLEPDKLLQNKYLSPVFSFFHIYNDNQIIVFVCIATVSIYIIKNVYLTFLSYVRVKFSCDIQEELSVKVMNSYMKRDYIFFTGVNSSELVRGVREDINRVYNMLSQVFRVLSEMLTSFAICVYIVSTNWKMTAGIIAISAICFVFVTIYFKRKLKTAGRERQKYDVLTLKYAMEAFNGIKEILVLDRRKYFVDNYESAYEKQQRAIISETVAGETPTYIIEAACVSGIICMIGIQVVRGMSIDKLVPQLAAFCVAAFRVLPSLARIAGSYNVMVFNKPGFDTTYHNLQILEEYEQKHPVSMNEAKGNGEQSFRKELAVNHVAWKYPESQEFVLKDINVTIRQGEAIGIVGESGGGKTTFADVILGLLPPLTGEVCLDGVNIKELGSRWNQIIGYVPQSIFLTDDSVRNNIAFGVPVDNIDDEKVWECLRQAQLEEYVRRLPQGLDTEVGERGVRFSGGQRQRIGVARALYHDPEILVLDEATSALDNKTESGIMEAIESFKGKKTLIIVAHRLTTIEKCDHVYEIAGGAAIQRR